MFKFLIKRAEAVLEALPYLKEFHGKVIVIKYGGSAMHDPELKNSLLRDVVFLKLVGMHPVVVHGGGPEISKTLKRRKIEYEFINGLRVTTKEVMTVVEHILGSKINKEILSLIKKHGGRAKGFCGKKGKIIKAQKKWIKDKEGNFLDLGFIGEVVGIRYRFLTRWMNKGYIPVLSPVGVGRGGQLFNINGDSAAASVAEFLKAEKLILLTDVRGVLDKKGNLVNEVDAPTAKKMIERKVISGGMIPKVQCGLHALQKGVKKVHIIDGQIPHALLLEIFTNRGIGTMVVK